MDVKEADFSLKSHSEAILRILDSYAKDPMGMDEPLDRKVRKKLISKMAEFPGTISFIAFDRDEAVGVANCFYGFSTFNAKKVLNIHDLAVLPAYRGYGAGGALLSAVEEKARRTDCCRVTLEVREDNQARNLYERAGYVYGDPVMYFMAKNLE